LTTLFLINIPGYVIERKDRNRSGGGIALFISETTNYKRLSGLQEGNLELLCVQILKTKVKPFIVGTWYRPPGSSINIMTQFEATLDKLETFHMEVSIVGDFNCNIGASILDHNSQKLMDIC